jgi:general stress protein 26
VSINRAKIDELWSPTAIAWWDTHDPAIRVLKAVPKDAQYWDSPGPAMSYVEMFTAAMSSTRPAVGVELTRFGGHLNA